MQSIDDEAANRVLSNNTFIYLENLDILVKSQNLQFIDLLDIDTYTLYIIQGT